MSHQRLDLRLLEFARSMRKNPTSPEQFMWEVLRGRRFAGYKFRRQHIVQPFILDFYCAELNLAVEIDGGYHATPEQKERDEARTTYLNHCGIRVVRYWNNEVINRPEQVLMHLWEIITPP